MQMIKMDKIPNGPVLNFDIAVRFVSDFDIRISDLVRSEFWREKIYRSSKRRI